MEGRAAGERGRSTPLADEMRRGGEEERRTGGEEEREPEEFSPSQQRRHGVSLKLLQLPLSDHLSPTPERDVTDLCRDVIPGAGTTQREELLRLTLQLKDISCG